MHDPRRHRALAKISAIRDAERGVARHELFLAVAREREAEEASRAAAQATDRAVSAWETQLGDGFHPELARALGGELIERIEAHASAREQVAEMTEGREKSEDAWRLGDARCRQAEQAFLDSRRARARDREEHALEALADHISFGWSRA